MQRLLYAINHKATEEKITEQIKDKLICVGAVTYKEAVISAIFDNHADIVLIRDTLGGHIKTEDLIQQIRLQCPLVRIVFLSSGRNKKDNLISTLISYGIYDIIVSDSISVQTIVSYLLEPRNFRDVAAYFKPLSFEDPDEGEKPSVEPGGLAGLFRRRKPEEKPQATPAVLQDNSPVSVNLEAMRAAIEEEANRKAQVGIQKIIDQEVETKTKDLQQKLKETEASLSAVNSSLQGQIKSEAAAGRELNEARNQVAQMKKEISEREAEMAKIKTEYEERLKTTKSTADPEWFLKRSQEMEAEISKLKAELKEAQDKTSEVSIKVDYSMDGSIVLPDMEDYVKPDPSDNHVFLFMGAKHGVGTTTAALNMAALLAATGQKTLLIELNSKYPMLNQYFEFTNLTAGVDTACEGLKTGNFRALESAIIKPHGLTPANHGLSKAYKKLPGGLHFMLFSNSYLLANKAGSGSLAAESFKDMIYALLIQLKYSYIIIDVQADEKELYDMCLNAGFAADKLVMVLSQDPHAMSSAGYLISDIAKTPSGKLVKDAVYLIDQNISSLEPSTKKIAKYLSTDPKQCVPLTLDRPGHIKAAMSALPYVYQGGQCDNDYKTLMTMVKS